MFWKNRRVKRRTLRYTPSAAAFQDLLSLSRNILLERAEPAYGTEGNGRTTGYNPEGRRVTIGCPPGMNGVNNRLSGDLRKPNGQNLSHRLHTFHRPGIGSCL